MSGRKLADALGRVIALRAELEQDADHKKRWLALKQWQIKRLRKTYADMLADDRYRAAAEFFLEELYGAKDVDRRDSEAQKVAPKLASLLPRRAVDALLLAIQLEEMSEQFDIEMSRDIDLPITEEKYAKAYRATGTKAERVRQIELADRIGKALEKLAKVPMLSGMLHMMKAPAAMWGLSHLHHFLESGFDAFVAMRGARDFLQATNRRELEINERLFAGDPDPFRPVD
ncbi:MAG: FFLEELY motif protein [Burkholderiaceae bacterium]